MNENKLNDQTIHVVMATDDNYAHHLAVVVASMLHNLSPERSLCLHVIYDELSDPVKEALGRFRSKGEFQLDLIKYDLSSFEDFKTVGLPYVSTITHVRQQLGDIFPKLKKCLYLDSDLVVRRDISELYDTDISGHSLGAIEESKKEQKDRCEDLGIPPEYGYFNAGVLLFDLDQMRASGCFKASLEYLDKNREKLMYADQDCLNAVAYDKWYALPLKWNVSQSTYRYGTTMYYLNYSKEEIEAAVRDPAIVHFIAKNKPDTGMCIHPFSHEYWIYLNMTPWKSEIVLRKQNED